jgi:hypothetical protein
VGGLNLGIVSAKAAARPSDIGRFRLLVSS